MGEEIERRTALDGGDRREDTRMGRISVWRLSDLDDERVRGNYAEMKVARKKESGARRLNRRPAHSSPRSPAL